MYLQHLLYSQVLDYHQSTTIYEQESHPTQAVPKAVFPYLYDSKG